MDYQLGSLGKIMFIVSLGIYTRINQYMVGDMNKK
jgi:hypothetical protein